MVPVPPRKLHQALGNVFRKSRPDGTRRIAGDDGVIRNVICDDGAGCNHSAGADAAAWQHDRAMADPDVVADLDAMALAPCEELGLVVFAREVCAGAISEVRLRRAMHA